MAADGPRGGDEERDWQDRESEPIPRARSEPPPGTNGSGAGGNGPGGRGPSDDDPQFPGADPIGGSRHRRAAPEDETADEVGVAASRGDPDHDPGRLDDVLPDFEDDPDAYRDPQRVLRDDPRSYEAGPEHYPDDPGVFVDDPTVYHEFPEGFVDDPDPGRYGTRTVGASFVVGEPVGEPLTEEELGGLRGGGTPLVTSRRVVPLEDEPSTHVQRYLFPTEKFRGEWRRHPIELAREAGIAIGATVVLGLLAGYLVQVEAAEEITTFLVIGWIAVLVWVAWQYADWWYDRFILTNKRVMVVSGIITRNVAMMPLQRVTDMKYVQSALGRMLNYGTFELESAGQDQALRSIPYLPSPNELYLRIVEEMYEPEAVEARLAGAQDVIDDGT
jgi:membrane protein YdbS with pleckstrin-like domain